MSIPAQGAEGAETMTAGQSLDLRDLHAANIARQAEWCPDQVPDLSFRGNELGGECGEAQNVIKKLERERQGWRGSRATKDDLADELADVVICADLCAVTADIDLGAAVRRKFNATSEKQGLSVLLPMPATPAPATPPGVPDSVRALSEAASPDWDTNDATPYILGPEIDGEIDRFAVIARGPAGCGQSGDVARQWKTDRMFAVACVKHVRRILAAHRAGQSTGQGAGISVDVATMRASNGTDYYVRIACDGREVTPHCFKERWKAEYEAAHYAWIFGLRADEPSILAFDPESHPNAPDSPLTGPAGVEEMDLRHVAQFVHAAMRSAVEAIDFEAGRTYPPLEDECGAWWSTAQHILWSLRFSKDLVLAARPAAPEAQGAWSFDLTPEQKPIKGFSNRAGETDTDDAIAAELEAAGIEPNRWEGLRDLAGEVKTAVRGSLHGWHFERAWYYWMAKGPGIELAAADVLHAAHPDTVRVNGHCGCPSPREQNNGLAIGSYHVDSPAGLKGLADTIKAIVARSAPRPPAREGAEPWAQRSCSRAATTSICPRRRTHPSQSATSPTACR